MCPGTDGLLLLFDWVVLLGFPLAFRAFDAASDRNIIGGSPRATAAKSSALSMLESLITSIIIFEMTCWTLLQLKHLLRQTCGLKGWSEERTNSSGLQFYRLSNMSRRFQVLSRKSKGTWIALEKFLEPWYGFKQLIGVKSQPHESYSCTSEAFF